MSLQIWQDRWQILDSQMEMLARQLEHSVFPRQSTLFSLAKRLRVFAAGQFRFLYNGFLNNTLVECRQHPQEYVLHGIISQITHDIHAIQRAAWQRRMVPEQIEKIKWETYKVQIKTAHVVSTTQDARVSGLASDVNGIASQILQEQDLDEMKSKIDEMYDLASEARDTAAGISEPGTMNELGEAMTASQSAKALIELTIASAKTQEALDIADRLAWNALQPAKDVGLIDNDTTVFVYFTKLQSIRIIPYAPVALIGIPFTCIDSPQDYLAIPHEIGHYVFRRGRHNNTDIHQEIETETDSAPWRAETFSDVYGCIVAGPVAALTFQAIQTEKKPKAFVTDDGRHATPMLRPYVYTQALCKTDFPGWGERLEELWDRRKEDKETGMKRLDTEKNTFHLSDANKFRIRHAISLGNIASTPPMDRIIDYTIDLFTNDTTLTRAQKWRSIIGPDLSPEQTQNPTGVRHAVDEAERLLHVPFTNHFEPGAALNPLTWDPPDDLPQFEQMGHKEGDICNFVNIQYASLNNIGAMNLSGAQPWPQPFFQVGGAYPDPNRLGLDEIPTWVHISLADGWNTFGNGVWTDHP